MQFDPLRISPSRAALFAPKLTFLNQRHIAHKTPTEIYDRFRPQFMELHSQDAESTALAQDNQYVESIINLLRSRVKVLSDLPAEAWYFFRDPEWVAGENTESRRSKKKKQFAPYEHKHFRDILTEVRTFLSSLPKEDFAEEEAVQALLKKAVASAIANADSNDQHKHARRMLRFVLCKGTPGPPIESIIATLGKDATLRRLSKVLQLHEEGFDFSQAP